MSIYLREDNKFLSQIFMSDSVVPRPGYVYCARRVGKPYYHLGSAGVGELSDRLQSLEQLEKNPKDIVLVGWIEVRDPFMAETKLKEAFELYHRGDGWFEFQASRASEFKALLTVYANLAEQLALSDRLIDRDGIPDYDRSFGFFEVLHQLNGRHYDPQPIASEPVKPVEPAAVARPKWVYGMAAAVALVGLLGARSISLQPALMGRSLSDPSPTASIAGSIAPITPPLSPTSSPTPSQTRPSAKPAAKPVAKPTTQPTTQPTNPQAVTPSALDGPQTVIWSPTSAGAQLRSAPSDSESPDDSTAIDFLPNGTPVILGEMSGAWQEVRLANGQHGWVSNSLVKD